MANRLNGLIFFQSLMKKSFSLLANYLYLRGMFWIACGENVKVINCY